MAKISHMEKIFMTRGPLGPQLKHGLMTAQQKIPCPVDRGFLYICVLLPPIPALFSLQF